MMNYEERKSKSIEMFNKGTIEQDTLGQLAINNFSDEIIERAVERKWISKEIANVIRGE